MSRFSDYPPVPNEGLPTTLAQQGVVSLFVYQMLQIAIAGDMTEKRAETLYKEIMDCYTKLDAAAVGDFVRDFRKILATAEPAG